MRPPVTSGTRLLALLGNPVAHSLSPVFQNAAIAAAGLDGVYLALRCDRADVPGLLRGIALSGGGGNVTLPHKELAATSVDRVTPAVQRTGACNTFWSEDGTLRGDNTDVEGVSSAVRGLLGAPPIGARVLLLGAGGSARAALVAMMDGRAKEVVVANRTRAKAEELVGSFGHTGATLRVLPLDSLTAEPFDLVINATSLGLKPEDPLPLAVDHGPNIGAALDLVYSSRSTPWVRALRERGIPASDGIEMLLSQGAASFERWWGVSAPMAEMRASLLGVDRDRK